jgi:site-specific recombinase XerC
MPSELVVGIGQHVWRGETRVSVKTKKLRGKAIVRGGARTATRTVGLLGGILTYAVEAGIIEINPAHGIRKPKDNVRKRRLSEAEYRILGRMLRDAAKQEKYATIVDVIRQLALTTYAVEAGIIDSNPAHGIRKPKDNVRKRRLSEPSIEYWGECSATSPSRRNTPRSWTLSARSR